MQFELKYSIKTIMGKKEIRSFLDKWVIPGALPSESRLADSLILTADDEALLGDRDSNDPSPELLYELRVGVEDLLSQIFHNDNIQSVDLGLSQLDWADLMPLTATIPSFAPSIRPSILVSRDLHENKQGKATINLDFGDDNQAGNIQFGYFDGECDITTLFKNDYGEKVTELDSAKNPIAHTMRMARFHEALGFIQNEREYRRGMPLIPYHERFATISE